MEELDDARSLLRDAILRRNRNCRSASAARALFAQLLSLNGQYGLHVVADRTDWNELNVQLGDRRVDVRFMDDYGIRVFAEGNQFDVPLDLDPGAERGNERYFGQEVDTRRVPVPGALPQRRPAISVLVEVILGAFKL